MQLKRFMLRRCAHCSSGCSRWVAMGGHGDIKLKDFIWKK